MHFIQNSAMQIEKRITPEAVLKDIQQIETTAHLYYLCGIYGCTYTYTPPTTKVTPGHEAFEQLRRKFNNMTGSKVQWSTIYILPRQHLYLVTFGIEGIKSLTLAKSVVALPRGSADAVRAKHLRTRLFH
jgi:hypothetical protein